MKIGIMGLGNIGQKAFLPLYITMHERVDWVVYSRNIEKGKKLQTQYLFKEVLNDMDAFLESGIQAVMIHTPTHTHYETIRIFLEKGIHVYVDKPLSENLEEVDKLYALAKQHKCILFVGFNRRFAPMYRKLKAINDKTMIIVQKNRAATHQDAKFAIFDMMSHVVDTALYLSEKKPTSHSIQTHAVDGILHHATITFHCESTTVIAIMNMMSGGNTERVEVMSLSGHYSVENMDRLEILTPESKKIESFGDWTPTLDKRGFKDMIEAFIEVIEKSKTSHDETNVKLTHSYLQKIYEETL